MGSCPKGYIQLPEYIDIHFTPLYIGGEVGISYSGRVDTPLRHTPKIIIRAHRTLGTHRNEWGQKNVSVLSVVSV